MRDTDHDVVDTYHRRCSTSAGGVCAFNFKDGVEVPVVRMAFRMAQLSRNQLLVVFKVSSSWITVACDMEGPKLDIAGCISCIPLWLCLRFGVWRDMINNRLSRAPEKTAAGMSLTGRYAVKASVPPPPIESGPPMETLKCRSEGEPQGFNARCRGAAQMPWAQAVIIVVNSVAEHRSLITLETANKTVRALATPGPAQSFHSFLSPGEPNRGYPSSAERLTVSLPQSASLPHARDPPSQLHRLKETITAYDSNNYTLLQANGRDYCLSHSPRTYHIRATPISVLQLRLP